MADGFVAFPVEGDELVCPTCGARFPHNFDGLMNGVRPHVAAGCEAAR